MNRKEHLLTCLTEECTEVAKNVSKALRFGLDDHSPVEAPEITNRREIVEEIKDVICVVTILQREGILPDFDITREDVDRKLAKIEHYMKISRANGVLSDGQD